MKTLFTTFEKVWCERFLYILIRLDILSGLIHFIHSLIGIRNFHRPYKQDIINYPFYYFGHFGGAFSSFWAFNHFYDDIAWTKSISFYAGDSITYESNHYQCIIYTILQKHFDIFINWCNLWSIKLNKSKTSAIYCLITLYWSNKQIFKIPYFYMFQQT